MKIDTKAPEKELVSAGSTTDATGDVVDSRPITDGPVWAQGVLSLQGLNSKQRMQRITELTKRSPPLTTAEWDSLDHQLQPQSFERLSVLAVRAMADYADRRDAKERADIDGDAQQLDGSDAQHQWVQAMAPWLSGRVSLTLREFAWLAVMTDVRDGVPTKFWVSGTKQGHFEQTFDRLQRHVGVSLTPLPRVNQQDKPFFVVSSLVALALSGDLGEVARVNIRVLVKACPRHAPTGAHVVNDVVSDRSAPVTTGELTRTSRVIPGSTACADGVLTRDDVVASFSAITHGPAKNKRSPPPWHAVAADVLAQIERGAQRRGASYDRRHLPGGLEQFSKLLRDECQSRSVRMDKESNTIQSLINQMGYGFGGPGAGKRRTDNTLHRWFAAGRDHEEN